MFYTSAEVLPQGDKTAQRLGEIADILFRYSRKDFNLRVGEREVRYTDAPRFVVVIDSPRAAPVKSSTSSTLRSGSITLS